ADPRLVARDRPGRGPSPLAAGAPAGVRGLVTRLAAATAAVTALALAALSVQPAHASRYLRLGIFDQGATLYGGETAFADYAALHVKELRLNLVWASVAKTRPAKPTDPADPAYDWSTYDAAARAAAADG